MKLFSILIRRFKFLETLMTMAVIFINIVIAPYSGYQLEKIINSSNEVRPISSNHLRNHQTALTYEDLYPNNKLNMSKETQNTIYTDILHIIKEAQKASFRKEKDRKKKFSLSTKNVPSNNSTNKNNNSNNHNHSKNKINENLISYRHSKSPDFYSNILKNTTESTSVSSVAKKLSPNTVISSTEDIISNSTDSEYLLGYSSNMFGSHTEYIEHMSVTSEVPRYVEESPSGKSENVAHIHQSKRKKRSVVHLYNMVLCATGCNPLSYKGYGCYCGFLGSGYVVDGIDSCCKMHDWCYDTAGCPMFLEYFIPYYWKCYHHRPLCAIDHGEYGGSGSCAQRLCECDKQLAMCLRRYPCPSTKAICTSSPWRLLQNIFML